MSKNEERSKNRRLEACIVEMRRNSVKWNKVVNYIESGKRSNEIRRPRVKCEEKSKNRRLEACSEETSRISVKREKKLQIIEIGEQEDSLPLSKM